MKKRTIAMWISYRERETKKIGFISFDGNKTKKTFSPQDCARSDNM